MQFLLFQILNRQIHFLDFRHINFFVSFVLWWIMGYWFTDASSVDIKSTCEIKLLWRFFFSLIYAHCKLA